MIIFRGIISRLPAIPLHFPVVFYTSLFSTAIIWEASLSQLSNSDGAFYWSRGAHPRGNSDTATWWRVIGHEELNPFRQTELHRLIVIKINTSTRSFIIIIIIIHNTLKWGKTLPGTGHPKWRLSPEIFSGLFVKQLNIFTSLLADISSKYS